MPTGPHGEFEAKCKQRGRQDPGPCGTLWGVWAKAGLVNSNQRKWSFGR